jgi:hypothetical protein
LLIIHCSGFTDLQNRPKRFLRHFHWPDRFQGLLAGSLFSRSLRLRVMSP